MMMMPGWGFARAPMRRFEEQYHCYSVAAADKDHLEKGDKILLPPSAFDTLARLQVDYPMLFQLTAANERQTHSGVLEFTAEEGCCYIPYWMMQNLLIQEGALLTVKNVSLPKAKYVKLQPQSTDFLEISNPRAVLEHALRNFSCVTAGDVIQIPYNSKQFHFALQQVQPAPAACIIETDCEVDFDAPVGYVPPPVPAPVVPDDEKEDKDTDEADSKPPGIRIVNGQIVRPEDDEDGTANAAANNPLIAPRVGQTGVQKNAAIPEAAPEVDYWALHSGTARRLDGKAPAPLKDRQGQQVDVRALRAQAAAKRAEAQKKESFQTSSAGKTLDGKAAVAEAAAAPTPAPTRKSRVKGKYSKLQSSKAYQGSANRLS